MAYTAGDLILDDHYNIFATGAADGSPTAGANINHVWSVGNGDAGYGQSTVLSPVSVGNTITATQWSTMLARITSAANHQASSITSITSPVAGDTIAAYAALAGNITTIHANRLNATANGSDIVPTPATSTSAPFWVTQTVHTLTCNFASADAARYFFNGGGRIRISFNIAGGTSDGKYDEWVDLANVLSGTVVIGPNGTTKSGGTGTPTVLATGIGYYQLTTSNQTLFQQFADSSPYTTNYIRVEARYTGTLGSNGDKSPQITITVTYRDDAADQAFDKAIYTELDQMTGTVTTNLVYRPPSTTYLTNTWGTPTMSFATAAS